MKSEFIKRILSAFILIPVVFFFIIKGSFFFNFFILICLLVTTFEWYQMCKKKKYFLSGIIFLLFSFFTVYDLRNDDVNLFLFLLIILTCISTDIGGYVFGKIFKGPKLNKISPNKTYSGMFGGFFLSIISINILINNNHHFDDVYFVEFTVEIFILVLSISLVSQIGDLTVSYFKRLTKIKNTGKIIPGHGGLLDRIDGMIFAFPFAYILFNFFIK